MMRLGAILVLIGAAGAALAAAADDQALIQQAAAQRTTAKASEPAAQPAPAAAAENNSLSQAERAARNEANLAQAKLELILGRKALMANKHEAAARKAQHVLVLLRQLPPETDVAEYELQAEGILAKAARAGVNVNALSRDATAETPLTEGDAAVDREVQGAARVARQYEGSARPDIDDSGDARLLRERTLRRQAPDRYGYRPGRQIIDVDAVAATDRQRTVYQEALRQAYKADEARLLVEADEARVVPDGDMSYPNDWPQRVARREKYAGGVVARTPSWFDKDGREWYVAIYDIHDLIYVPPDFGADGPQWGPNGLRDTLDRQALRDRSMIFGGTAEDLAAGIPLLHYFGGLNPWATRGPKYSMERQAEVVNMIRAFTGAKVEGERPELPPAP